MHNLCDVYDIGIGLDLKYITQVEIGWVPDKLELERTLRSHCFGKY